MSEDKILQFPTLPEQLTNVISTWKLGFIGSKHSFCRSQSFTEFCWLGKKWEVKSQSVSIVTRISKSSGIRVFSQKWQQNTLWASSAYNFRFACLQEITEWPPMVKVFLVSHWWVPAHLGPKSHCTQKCEVIILSARSLTIWILTFELMKCEV